MAANIDPSFHNWSATAASNQPDGTDTADIDAELRQIQSVVRKFFGTKGSDIASATTTNLATATGDYVHITGTTTIEALGTVAVGWKIWLVFDDALTLTHNATSLILPTVANISTAAGDRALFVSLGSGNWRCLVYTRASGATLDPELAALAGLTSAANKIPRFTGAGTADVLDFKDEDDMASDSATALPSQQSVKAYVAAVSNSQIAGLILSNAADADHDITISTGICADSTGAYTLSLSSALTKQIDAAWSAGDAAGGLDTGSVANSTWYHVWLIRKDSDGTIDALFSTSESSPTMPAGYTAKRLAGSVLTDGSANIRQFTSVEDSGGGIITEWNTQVMEKDGAAGVIAGELLTVTVPSGYVVEARLVYGIAYSGAANGWIRSPSFTSVAASQTVYDRFTAAGSTLNYGNSFVLTNTSAQIQHRESTASADYDLATIGWKWRRR